MKSLSFKYLILLFVLPFVGCSSYIFKPESPSAIRGYVKPELSEIERIAVLPFRGDADNLFADLFSICMGKYTNLKIIERREVEELISEQDFYPDRIDPRTVARIGRMLGVQAVVLGDVLYAEEILGNYQGTLKIRIVHVETGAILAQFIDSGSADTVCERIVRRILTSL